MANSSKSTGSLFTKGRAILAGGLVLGVGAVVTLAAWNDSEWAQGNFKAGEFGIEGSEDGTTFANHPTDGPAATLDFSVGADNLTPGDVVYANYAVRLSQTSTYAAEVDIESQLVNEDGHLAVSHAFVDSAAGCSAAAFTGTDDPESFSLDAHDETQNICIRVTAGSDLLQGETGTVTFTFNAESTTSL
ncbi:SipW-dependent-type signal peptide-containing protein [Gulosibacter faecalis]|uniref:SipW-dependent-type signal peptide-containing protein n=1 Tax=Gulosibacter faecalis TaxID=272240 RepID=A0ABW5UY53_9MICO|nr:SipW-dependent-type signal peptide-containing protein [Gulosibacter faecalis]